ncbi:peptidase S16 lon domain-containing protein [Nitritalea halalkaliphila LW7]|uniref:Peptidase S16 lon domain-containing protein n=1 Tax=Nitritalea halalkaliphila LW7 TaxID=1189621 RepID=I5C4A2_9BACT|nr:LON peptidase substrate-binding domain-containing protein [Nitritalea halalkaliphila]EIM76654.1 peptidase S16 lon domain-containing protein [Nitritalea halalkaliphila LW7]
MESRLPLFPLKLVAFPGEKVNLHIFEPRYRQLVGDLEAGDGRFGLCVYSDSLLPIGTLLELSSVEKRYADGRFDISCRATRTFQIQHFFNPLPGKLYAGGDVVFREQQLVVIPYLMQQLMPYVQDFFRLMGHEKTYEAKTTTSFDLAHKLGLSLDQEYALLLMPEEEERISFLREHLLRVLPVLREAEKARQRIQLNGHFKHLDPLDF